MKKWLNNVMFFFAYAEINSLKWYKYSEVMQAIKEDRLIQDYLQYCDCPIEAYIDDYLAQYRVIKKYNLIHEIASEVQYCKENGHLCTIWEAAQDWDVAI